MLNKIRILLEQVDGAIVQENPAKDTSVKLTPSMLSGIVNELKEVLGERNTYSKTDPDATFMRMKEDAMKNGQTKPGYNLQQVLKTNSS